jgi:DNA repair protein RAD5
MDLNIISFEGTCIDVGKNFKSGKVTLSRIDLSLSTSLFAGDGMLLSLTPSISRAAFAGPNTSRVNPVSTSSTTGKKTFHEDLKETSSEKILRERKSALNRLFDKTNLHPLEPPNAKGKNRKSSSQSKRSILESYDAGALKKKGKGEEEDGDEEGEEMSEMQLNMVCQWSSIRLNS